MYNVMIVINTAICYVKVLRVNPKNSHHKENISSYFFNPVSIFDDGCLTELIVIITSLCIKSNLCAVYLKLIQCMCQLCLKKTGRRKIWIPFNYHFLALSSLVLHSPHGSSVSNHYYLSLEVSLLDILDEWNLTVCGLLWLSLINMFLVYML